MVRFKLFQRVLGLLALVFCGLLGQHAAMAAGKAAAAPEGAPSGSPLRFAVEVEPENSNQNKSWPTIGYSTALTKQLGQPVKVVNSVLLREVARGSWAGEFDAMWVPANLAVGMLNKGFEIVGCDGQMVRMALLSAPSIKGFNDLNGKTLFLPQEDSLAAYVAIALLDDNNVKLSDFRYVFSDGSYEVARVSIEQQVNHLTVLPEAMASKWIAANPGKGKILATSSEVPWHMLVAKKSLAPETKQKLATWVSDTMLGGRALTNIGADKLKYVSRLGHYTPDSLEGVIKVTAVDAARLAQKGAAIVDVRTTDEFSAKHIQGAKLVPYHEDSPRVAGGKYLEDGFDVDQVATQKQVIYYCNGPECWKSYKAAQRTVADGRVAQVYWLRGGLPEWERQGLPVVH